jgi:DNA-directed RNA polymerase specialized sigma24 family protein
VDARFADTERKGREFRTAEVSMGARGPKPVTIALSASELREIEAVLAAGKTEQRVAMRARVFLLSHEGVGPTEIARRLEWHPNSVMKLLARFREDGLNALYDKPRSGRPRRFSPSAAGGDRLTGMQPAE